jgi:POT family proton-dependent oligopeptide transporter
LIVPAIPKVIAAGSNHTASYAIFFVSIIILAFASGFIKPCLAVLLCDQAPIKVPTVQVTKKGERVICDPQTTVQRYLLVVSLLASTPESR